MNERSEDALEERAHEETEAVVGERSVFSVDRVRSLQSRITNLLAAGLVSALGLGLLAWYYAHTFVTQSEAKRAAQSAPRAKSQGDLPLPSLGRITPPAAYIPTPTSGTSAASALLGPPPEPPPAADAELSPRSSPSEAAPRMPTADMQAPVKSQAGTVLARRLTGPAFSSKTESSMTNTITAPESSTSSPPGTATLMAESSQASLEPGSHGATVADLLRPTTTPAVRANVLPTQRLLLPKGAFVDCTLETAIDSTLPGMTTCVTATDTFSADGSVVLIERGTKLVGETRGEVSQGSSRVFVLWTEARTPTGVVIPIASPGTDELGRSGFSGDVNRHFWQRFGAAILISVIDGGVQELVQGAASSGGGMVVFNPSGSSQVMTEVLRGTVNIPPTVRKHQGDRIQILVARDVDFRSVYELRVAR